MLKTLRTALIVLLLPVGAAQALPYSSLYVFGDSLSDSGRAYNLANTPNAVPPPSTFSGEQWLPSFLGYAQRFSNGPTAAEGLAAALGVTATPFGTPGGTNYAVGGARSGLGNFNWLVNSPAGINTSQALRDTGVFSQISDYFGSGPHLDVATSLFMVSGGANDFFLASATGQLTDFASIAALANQAADNITGVIQLLAVNGANNFFVPNLPDIGRTPLFGDNAISGPQPPGAAGVATLYSQLYNIELAQNLATVQSETVGMNLIAFDSFSIFNAVLDNPAAYGFDPAKSDSSCLYGTLAGTTTPGACSGYLFWDDVHPSAATHLLTASFYAAAVVPAPGTVMLIAFGLVVVGFASARGRRALLVQPT